MRLMSIDQSSTSTGVGFFVDGILTNYTLIKPKSSKKIDEIVLEAEPHLLNIKMPESQYDTTLLRITAITDQIEKCVEDFKPDVVYFEEIFENKNPNGFRSLARMQGFLCHIFHQHGIPYHIVSETQWITAFGTYDKTIKRAERKEDVKQKVNKLYGLNIEVDDLSDGIGIGVYGNKIEEGEWI